MTTDTYPCAQELQDLLDSHEYQLIQFAKRVKREVLQPLCNKYNMSFVVSDKGFRFIRPHTYMPDSFYTELDVIEDILYTLVSGDYTLGMYVGNVEPVK